MGQDAQSMNQLVLVVKPGKNMTNSSEEKYCGWFIDWIEQWSQFIRHDNWNTFVFIQIEFEDDRCMGGVETTIILLGLGFRLRWNYKETDRLKEIKGYMADILERDD